MLVVPATGLKKVEKGLKPKNFFTQPRLANKGYYSKASELKLPFKQIQGQTSLILVKTPVGNFKHGLFANNTSNLAFFY